ncbi:hypothetical protein UFOVP75_187 [uncultured Caudovirales phage]|uniref:Uncharacterized protein n=1 Tax=uncultured Caudovirales phage TaxID=2100421 RepID=A0A6J5L6A3_9CAUD|nr:hypothetical protein UFOVP75_187 [uncultured Caudovirales phage]
MEKLKVSMVFEFDESDRERLESTISELNRGGCSPYRALFLLETELTFSRLDDRSCEIDCFVVGEQND